MSSTAHPTSLASFSSSSGRTISRDVAGGVPWYIWTGVVGITSATIGAAWDVAWHRSIGRDTFWTPAHLMIQLCGVLAAVVGLWLTYQSTFNKNSPTRAASVSLFGLRAPLGVFLAGWGGVAMITSAPFDNWWHDAYGLDVKIVSPPHTLLILGIRAVSLGVFFLILASMNRAAAEGSSSFSTLQKLLLYLGGLTIDGQMFFLQEYTWDVELHRALAYIALAIAIPVVFALISQASRFRWAATTAAAIYTVLIIGQILIFPLVSAEPKLGPVYNPITHLIPAKFPVLIIVPAIALDLLWSRTKNWKMWQIALVSGVLFVAIMTAVEWRFASFLLSKASENRFFGTTYFAYFARPESADRLRFFSHPDFGAALWLGLLRASVYAAIST
jgi:hypothetical protein